MPREMWQAVIQEARRAGYSTTSEFIRGLIRDYFKKHP
jgi:metal-responsive CopG/Arc/MetJ family transcriptional regulator